MDLKARSYKVTGINSYGSRNLRGFFLEDGPYIAVNRLSELLGKPVTNRVETRLDVLAGVPSIKVPWGYRGCICIKLEYLDALLNDFKTRADYLDRPEVYRRIGIINSVICDQLIPDWNQWKSALDNSKLNEKEPRSDRGWAIGSEPKASNNIDTSIMPQESISLQGLFEQDLADQNAVVDNVLKCVYATKYKFSKRSLEYFIRRLEMELKYIYRYD